MAPGSCAGPGCWRECPARVLPWGPGHRYDFQEGSLATWTEVLEMCTQGPHSTAEHVSEEVGSEVGEPLGFDFIFSVQCCSLQWKLTPHSRELIIQYLKYLTVRDYMKCHKAIKMMVRIDLLLWNMVHNLRSEKTNTKL